MALNDKNTDTIVATVSTLALADQIRLSMMSDFKKKRLWLFVFENADETWSVSAANEFGGVLGDEMLIELMDYADAMIPEGDLKEVVEDEVSEQSSTGALDEARQ